MGVKRGAVHVSPGAAGTGIFCLSQGWVAVTMEPIDSSTFFGADSRVPAG